MTPDQQQDDPRWQDLLRLAASLGFQIAVPLVGLTLLGRWLDVKFASSPLFLLIGVGVSIGVSSLVLMVTIKRILK